MYNLGFTPSATPSVWRPPSANPTTAPSVWRPPSMAQTQPAQPAPNVFDTAGGAYNQAVSYAGNVPKVRSPNVAPVPMVTSRDVTAGQLATTDLQPYFNPYTSAVTDNVMADLERQRLIAMNETDAAASAAFGGSRHGVMQAETNRGFADAVATASAELNQANYTNAQGAAFQDIGNKLTADTSNQSSSLQASIANSNNSLQSNLANASNSLMANMANADNRLKSASTLGELSGLGFNLGNTALAAQSAAGLQQQQLQQTLMDRGKEQYLGVTGAQDEAIARLLAVLGGVPAPVTTSTSSNPGLLGMAAPFL